MRDAAADTGPTQLSMFDFHFFYNILQEPGDDQVKVQKAKFAGRWARVPPSRKREGKNSVSVGENIRELI